MEGNAALKSEISHNLNLSAEYVKGHYNLTASAYYNKVENKLATGAPYFRTPSDKLPYLPYTNLDGYSVYGGEIGVQARWDNGMSARLTYAYTKEELPTDKQGNAVNNQYIPARRHSLNVRYDYDRQFSARYGISAGISGRLLSGTENEEYRNYYFLSCLYHVETLARAANRQSREAHHGIGQPFQLPSEVLLSEQSRD